MRLIPLLKKRQRAVIWTAYARLSGRIVAYVIGEGIASGLID